MKLVLFGAPGVGKGTQAKLLSEELKIPAISTGELLRAKIERASKASSAEDSDIELIKSYVDAGKLVPDMLIGEVLKSRVDMSDCKNGYILDGFPRSLSQAKLLEQLNIVVDKVVEILVSEQTIVERLECRRVCENCGETYNTEFKMPQKSGICDCCGGRLIRRSDDSPDTILQRLKVYRTQTKPLVAYYSDQKKYFSVSGDDGGGADQVKRNILKVIGESI